ncbi:transposase, partial [Pseudomonas aeruginosa]|uniref:transposase n=1 Tax=Pseudomonas aeruginosa TaxID=287 RepID=UPI00301BE44C
MIDVLGPEKRRRRTTQEKIAIVQQSFEPGMTVSLVARQHGVKGSQGNDLMDYSKEQVITDILD